MPAHPASQVALTVTSSSATSPDASPTLREGALHALLLDDPAQKVLATGGLRARVEQGGEGAIGQGAVLAAPQGVPGRPARPLLVPPQKVERRGSLQSTAGRAVLIHALAHIEFNAINLALDAVWRFAAMPAQFYLDWLQVAEEEALHYSLLAAHLEKLGYRYGDFPAHDSLWEMADRTAGDPLARMALVPRTLEARGLDACPVVRTRLADAGDAEAAAIIDIILRDEVGHVAIGNHWYRWLCEQRGLDPVKTYASLSEQYRAPRLRPPFNLEARRRAGFDEEELAWLEGSAG
ncbi:ferritin-like domain-containing protein [Cupriavidus sp. AU9028]|uniref:ferritin-like domain-containing protein n=1 Tax=Cupriavidus sp. AU9028 TaxID=2871157 RepID=UPI001C94F3FA|nr:ferritin-like domain-containing protein [Cupriavidus sp. AU9028]MBY4898739.1 ferritin-like domain-containing protein [Cupriavidus sp. AU9028]